MIETIVDAGAELANVVAYAVGTVVLSAVGLFAEYNGLQELGSGQQLLAVWFAFMGVVALAFAWNLATRKLLPNLTANGGS
ncbi:hypothetical protein [Halorussus litoreus]|uniref:hypothetical protein n=1 Tax=Halorussus litoreus TaxID=1710536 RepID=UPI000E25DC69|nr:hypothetical protein [Halorussus litoreus]